MWWGTLYLIFQKPTIAYDPLYVEKNNIPHVANGGAIVEKEVWGTGSYYHLLNNWKEAA